MLFNPIGFMLAAAMTQEVEDRDRAARISLLGGMLGPSPVGAMLLAVAARDGRLGPGAVVSPAGGSSAPARVQVPELPDDPDKAKRLVEDRGLAAEISPTASDEPLGGVIGSIPEADSFVPWGSTVAILVSVGLEVPDVVGKQSEEGESILEAAGFEAERTEIETKKPGSEGLVESQHPEGGSFAAARSKVTLYVFPSKPRLSAAGSSAKE